MKKHLLKLANTLDKLGLSIEANIVDYYLTKESKEDFLKVANDFAPEKRGDVNISLPSGNIVINVFSDPLGSKIRSYAEKVAGLFNEDYTQRTGMISVKEIDDIVDDFKQRNNSLKITGIHWSDNTDLIYPQTVSNVVKAIGSYVYHNLSFTTDSGLYIDALEDIDLTYNDFYTEDYLGSKGFDEYEYSSKVDKWREENPGAMNEMAEGHYALQKIREEAAAKKQMQKEIEESETEEIV